MQERKCRISKYFNMPLPIYGIISG